MADNIQSLDFYDIIGRTKELFNLDYESRYNELKNIVTNSKFLVIGAGGSIGSAVVKEIFQIGALQLDCIDINENSLTELVRILRSEFGYTTKNFNIFALDVCSNEFDAFVKHRHYDYVLNLSAIKHVRSEANPFTISRMLKVNILANKKIHDYAVQTGAKNYFCVSTDKAANPVNLMGATKKAMEISVLAEKSATLVSSARFANVAFSNGSLLQGFENRVRSGHPITFPRDVQRFFISPKEAGVICLFSSLFGGHGDIYFPHNVEELRLTGFQLILERFLISKGFEPYYCDSEDQARERAAQLLFDEGWPVYSFGSDTAGEKHYEEFFTDRETIDLEQYNDIGVVKTQYDTSVETIHNLIEIIKNYDPNSENAIQNIIRTFEDFLPDFQHAHSAKTLNERM